MFDFFGSVHPCPIQCVLVRDKQVIMMRGRTTDHDLILLKRPFSVLPSEPWSSFPSHLHLKGHERSQMRPDKTRKLDGKLTETTFAGFLFILFGLKIDTVPKNLKKMLLFFLERSLSPQMQYGHYLSKIH